MCGKCEGGQKIASNLIIIVIHKCDHTQAIASFARIGWTFVIIAHVCGMSVNVFVLYQMKHILNLLCHLKFDRTRGWKWCIHSYANALPYAVNDWIYALSETSKWSASNMKMKWIEFDGVHDKWNERKNAWWIGRDVKLWKPFNPVSSAENVRDVYFFLDRWLTLPLFIAFQIGINVSYGRPLIQ